MHLLLNQRLKSSEKDSKWRKSMIDYFCNFTLNFSMDWKRMKENYDLKNNHLNREEYTQICKGFGSEESATFLINAYNKTHNIIESLKGEELNRPFSFSIVNESPDLANRIDREKRMFIEEFVATIFEIEIQKQNELIELELKNKSSSLGEQIQPQQMDMMKQEIENKYKKLYNDIPNIKEKFSEFENISSLEEITLSKIMKMIVNKLNLRNIKNSCFEDVLLAGVECVEILTEYHNEIPKIKPINPIFLFYHKSPDVEFIQDGDYAGYVQYLTVTQILNLYGDRMSEDDVKKLTTIGMSQGAVRGLDYPWTSDKGKGQFPMNEWEYERNYSSLGGFAFDNSALFTNLPQFGAPDFGYIAQNGSTSMRQFGLNTPNVFTRFNDLIQIWTVYWKSQRKVGRYTFVNDYGEYEDTIVDEDFVIPKYAKKETIKDDCEINKDIILYTWTDKENKKHSVEWIWIPEIWGGKRIGYEFYIDVGPVEDAYQSLLNPYRVKLPIYGHVYNSRNSFSVSIMDRMKPWQKIYYVIMARLLKLLSIDKGQWVFLNTMLFDKDLGIEKTMQIAEDQGYVLYNPLSNTKGAAGYVNTMKIAETLNMTNASVVQYYIEILRFIEENIKVTAGMSDQRMAQSNPRMTATDNYRETMHSVNMTEPLHAAHDLLWQQILQGYMEKLINVLSNNTGLLRGFINDEEKVLVDFSLINLEDNYTLRVGDNTKAYRILEQMKQLSQALIQNDKVNIETLIDLLSIDNLSDFKTKMGKIEKENEMKMSQRDDAQRQHEQEMLKMQLKAKEDEQIQQLDNTYLKGLLDLYKEDLRSKYQNMSFDTDKDYNKDGIADYLQLAQLQQKITNESNKIELENKKIEQKDKELNVNITNKEKDRQDKLKENESDRLLKQRIEKLKLNKIKRT